MDGRSIKDGNHTQGNCGSHCGRPNTIQCKMANTIPAFVISLLLVLLQLCRIHRVRDNTFLLYSISVVWFCAVAIAATLVVGVAINKLSSQQCQILLACSCSLTVNFEVSRKHYQAMMQLTHVDDHYL